MLDVLWRAFVEILIHNEKVTSSKETVIPSSSLECKNTNYTLFETTEANYENRYRISD